MPAIFAVTLFVGSFLLFLVQPLCAKMVLPLLGGSPGVWNTCMVFFQAGLLAGYAYAHAGTLWLGRGRLALLHLGLLILAFLFTPIVLGKVVPSPEDAPVFWLLRLLLVSAGLPFVMLAAGAPLVQKWYAGTDHAGAKDPYFLYAASNLGSMVALLGYPFLVEPNFTLSRQSLLWRDGYGVLIFLTAACGLVMWLRKAPETPEPASLQASNIHHADRLGWVLLALIPSSFMLSVTSFLTTDIAAVPLLWVGPLAIYLLSFILVFAGKPLLPHVVFIRFLPVVALVLAMMKLAEATKPMVLLLSLHLLGLFWICMVCHGELAKRRPAADHLTQYYLWLAVGGVLGGLFNTLVAPALFTTVVEYPLMLVLACLALPRSEVKTPVSSGKHRSLVPRGPALWDLLLPGLIGLITAGLILLGQSMGIEAGPMSVAFMFMVPLVVCYTFMGRPIRYGLGLGAILLASGLYAGVHGKTEYRARSFFGVHRVTRDQGFRKLVHGNTVHGMQSLDPEEQPFPLTYYHRNGPIGKMFAALEGDSRLEKVGLIGLGTGALAYYAGPNHHWTFFEIDPEVIRLASPKAKLFTYLGDTWDRQAQVDVVVGDGRLGLAKSQDTFGLIVVDAFNSDSIPVHLLTQEALQIYRSKLKAGGILAFHISNRYLDLGPVLGNLAAAANPPWECLLWQDRTIPELEERQGRTAADWLLMAASPADLAKLPRGLGTWRKAPTDPSVPVWTDDFSNLIQVFKWSD